MNAEELKKRLEEIDDLVKTNVINEGRAKEWKERLLSEFERTGLPSNEPDKPKSIMETTDMAHLPGRIVGWGISFGAAFLRGCGNTYVELSKQQGHLDQSGRPHKEKKQKSPDELLRDLPEQYR